MKKPVKPKPVKKITKKKLASMARTAKRKALSAWSHAVRDRDGNACIICGSTKYNQAHHLLSKEYYKDLQFEIMNGVCVCASCHKYSGLSFHKNGFFGVSWMAKNRPDQYKWVMEHLEQNLKN